MLNLFALLALAENRAMVGQGISKPGRCSWLSKKFKK
jgi:hypothetical protein